MGCLFYAQKLKREGGGHIGPNQRQKLFADEYLISEGYSAAIKAGHSGKYAKSRCHELLKMLVSAYIEERMKELEKKKIAKQDEYKSYRY
ncbi:MAG: terminase small subunit [Streptococcus sp.]